VSDVPVVATHHGLRDVNNIPRNMPDELLKKLAAKGGVMGFQIGSEFSYPKEYAYLTARQKKSFWETASIPDEVKGKTIYEVDELVAPQFPMLGAKVPDSVMMAVDDWVAVVDRAIQLVGEDHVAIGTDFDGGPTLARGMRDVRDLAMITDAMLRRGYTEERIDKFWGGNLLRVFRQITQNHG
jgi:membrane dipeptidase